jgi:hypothetical protein
MIPTGDRDRTNYCCVMPNLCIYPGRIEFANLTEEGYFTRWDVRVG